MKTLPKPDLALGLSKFHQALNEQPAGNDLELDRLLSEDIVRQSLEVLGISSDAIDSNVSSLAEDVVRHTLASKSRLALFISERSRLAIEDRVLGHYTQIDLSPFEDFSGKPPAFMPELTQHKSSGYQLTPSPYPLKLRQLDTVDSTCEAYKTWSL